MDGKIATAPANAAKVLERAYVGFYVGRETRDALLQIGQRMGGLSLSDVARAAVIEYVKRNGGDQQ